MTEQELLTWTANIERKAVNDVKSGYSDPPKHPMCDAVLYIGNAVSLHCLCKRSDNERGSGAGKEIAPDRIQKRRIRSGAI